MKFRPNWVTEARRARAEEDGTVVLRHLDRLSDVSLRVITAALQDALRRQLNWVVITREHAAPSAEMARLLRLFPTTVEVPPLGHHVEDVEQLVPFPLRRLGCGGQLTCSPEAMQQLLLSTWPGNVQQVLDVLRHVVRHRRTGVIVPGDLPPDTAARSRRRLSTL